MYIYLDKYLKLVHAGNNNQSLYVFPTGKWFYIRAAIYQKTGILLSLSEVKKLIIEEFGQARLDTHHD